MPGPYVRRLRLARELRALRGELSIDALARAVGSRRQRLSEIENCRVRPDDDEIRQILDFFHVAPERRAAILLATADARHVGWWEAVKNEIGPRQALYANLEAGAQTICEYQLTLLPGLLQTPEFTASRANALQFLDVEAFDADRAIEARTARQANLLRPDAPQYHVIIDELAVRRFAAEEDVVRRQLVHLASVLEENPGITVQILPIAAKIPGRIIPQSTFSIYRYPDPEDPVVVAVDTITSDLLVTEPQTVAHYSHLHHCLSEAALSRSDTFDFLVMVDEDVVRTGRRR